MQRRVIEPERGIEELRERLREHILNRPYHGRIARSQSPENVPPHHHFDEANGGTLLLTAYKDTDQEVTNTTLTADSELSVTLLANGKYQFEIKLFILNDGAGEGVKVSLNGGAAATDVKGQVFIWDDTLNTFTGARITSLGGAGVGAGMSSGSNFVRIEGAIEVTTPGTFYLEFAQNATGASAGVHCEVGSSMLVTRLE